MKMKTISVLEIFILLVGTVAISWMIGGEVGVVSAATTTPVPAGSPPPGGGTGNGGGATDSPPGAGIQGGKTPNSETKGGLVQGLMAAGGVYGVIQGIGGSFSDNEAGVNAFATGVSAGVLVYNLMAAYGSDNETSWLSKKNAGWAGLIVAVAIIVLMYKSESEEIVTFECKPWDAPVGGKRCEDCNEVNNGLPCSEYQCHALGQSCSLENAGTGEEICFWNHRDDALPPEITAWRDALSPDHSYTPDKTISPPDRGVIIMNDKATDGCIKAFTPLEFGITTNEPARCKLDYQRKDTFEEMGFFFGGSSTFKYNHTQIMSLPGPDSLKDENVTIQNGGNFELYTRCIDANGKKNTASFVFKFCVDKGPDTTPPQVMGTNLNSGMPIAYNTTEMGLEVYVNEPAECRWSRRDQNYNDMEEEEMVCSSSAREINAQMVYTCRTTLNGLKNKFTNEFYIRCKDKPNGEDRNEMAQSHYFSLIGTQPLVIEEVSPENETIKDATEAVKVDLEVRTAAGYDEGRAMCYFGETENDDNYILFAETDSYKHLQELYLPEGNYEYFIKCVDLGGNPDKSKISFKVETDRQAPVVVRTYRDSTYLKIITDEEAECVYDPIDCNYLFEDGTSIQTSSNGREHFVDWNTRAKYNIKCKDSFGNEPLPNQCSIVARPFEVYE